MKFNLKETLILGSITLIFISSCSNNSDKQISKDKDSLKAYVAERLPIYAKVRLTTDIKRLSENERKVLPLLIRAAEIMDQLFWMQTYPKRDSLLSAVEDEKTREFIKINYGPWDRLNDNKPFVKGIGSLPRLLAVWIASTGRTTFCALGAFNRKVTVLSSRTSGEFTEALNGTRFSVFFCGL